MSARGARFRLNTNEEESSGKGASSLTSSRLARRHGYPETRNWTFEKLRTFPHGSQQLDIKMYHYLYFANLFGAVDLLRAYIKASGEKLDFEDRVLQAFPRSDDYRYARELRNAIVHRGLDPAAAGHSDNNILYVLCPSSAANQSGRASYSCSFQYTVQLAERCDSIINPAIFDFLESYGFLNPRQFRSTRIKVWSSFATPR
jgi:hypothetical protein